MISRRLATFLRSRSTKVAWAAPRDSASSPSAPLPANRSRQRLPGTLAISQLNRVSRTRSGVGRMPPSPGKRMRRPRHSPPMMRRVWIIFCSAHPLNLRDDTRPRPPHCRSHRHEQPPCRRTPRRWLPACGMLGLELRRHRADRSDVRQRRSGQLAGRRRVPRRLRAALRRAALPDRPLFQRLDRRHAELAGDAVPAERGDDQRARRFLDGRELDRAVLGADRSGDDLARDRDRARGRVDNATKATIGFARALVYGTDYTARVAPTTDSGGSTLEIVPLRPLTPSTGATNVGYLVILTDGLAGHQRQRRRRRTRTTSRSRSAQPTCAVARPGTHERRSAC